VATKTNFWQNNKGIILFLFLMLFFRSAIADWYHVPSGSMKPTILIGDRVWVNKLAYDIKLPLTNINLNRHAEPERGDVVVFDSKASDNLLIKRVIGVPGDQIELFDNQLFLNGKALQIELLPLQQDFDIFLDDRENANYYREYFDDSHKEGWSDSPDDDKSHIIRIVKRGWSSLDSFDSVIVGADQLWVMGDNRDNSADSRVIGLVPRNELVGRAESVILSFDNQNFYLPRSGRYSVGL
jgi:signal peptidase I